MGILIFTAMLLVGLIGLRWIVCKDRFHNADLVIGVYQECCTDDGKDG